MTQSTTTAGKKILMTITAAFAACILMMSCAAPAFAKEDPGWGTSEYVNNDPAGGTNTEGNNSGAETNESGNEGGDNEESSRNPGNHGSGGSSKEQGFTTPGNGNLGDQIKSSNGKDFYTIHTKNNNTFYLVIDHTNSAENVYMLSLIDEDDLAEFLSESSENKEAAVPPVVIPETKPQTETTEAEKPQVQQPAAKPFLMNGVFWAAIAVIVCIGAFYYLKVYKPGHTEETSDSEGMETEDFPTETEE